MSKNLTPTKGVNFFLEFRAKLMPWTNKIVSDVVNLKTNTKGEQDVRAKANNYYGRRKRNRSRD